MIFVSAQSTTIAPPLTPKNSTLLLTVIISSVILLHIIILCLAVVYISNKIHKRRLANRQANPLVMMRTQNLAPITPEAMSEETLNDILRGNLIHQGAMSAVRLATYKGQEVAVKVYQPCSNKRWLNEKEIYEVLGDHPNIAKVRPDYTQLQNTCFTVLQDTLHDCKALNIREAIIKSS